MGSYELHPARVGRHLEMIRADPVAWFCAVYGADVFGYADVYRFYFQTFQEVIVARGKSNAKATPANARAAWTTFVEIPLGNVSWEDIHKAYGAADAAFDAVQELLLDGYRMSFSFNEQSDAVICSVTCKAEGSPNSGKTFSAFAATWTDALITALYKHFVIAGEVWTGDQSSVQRPRFG